MERQAVSHYRIFARLGSGGMGVVYRAEDERLGRQVALKFLPPEMSGDQVALERFRREARTASALNHPNICTDYDIGEEDGDHFIAMELLEGGTLRERLAAGAIPTGELLVLAIQVADALAAAHESGVIHRDIKPANIFITRRGLAKVLDFGLAKPAAGTAAAASAAPTVRPSDPPPRLTEAGATVGTVHYMSPEQARGEELDARTDLFSFGTVLYEMATGRLAFPGATSAVVFDAILNRVPSAPAAINPAIPTGLAQIIEKALEKDRELRYQSAAELRADLRRLQRDSETTRVRAASGGPAAAARRPGLRRGAITALAAGVVVAVAAWVGWRLLSPPVTPLPIGGRLSMLVSSPSWLNDPALSPDGRLLAYVADERGTVDLFVNQVAGGARLRLTDDEAREAAPDFSPDGNRLAFVRYPPGGEAPEGCVMPALGGTVVPVVRDAIRLRWSPDGSRLAFIRLQRGQPRTVATVGADGRDPVEVLAGDPVYPFPRDLAWAPDGRSLIVARSSGGQACELWLVPLDGGGARRLWDDPPGVFSKFPEPTADGRGVVYISNRGGASNVWYRPLAGGEPVQLTSGPGPDEKPSLTRAGAIAFLNVRERLSMSVHDLAAGTRTEIATHSSPMWAPAFSPDLTEVAYSRSEADGAWHVWTVPIGGGEPRRLTSSSLPELYPRYTPDGAWITYCTWSPGPDRIWRVARGGGPAEPLTPQRDEDDQYGEVSPDGRWLAFARTEAGQTRVCIQAVAGGPARRLTAGPSTVPRWSPDGTLIAFAPDRSDTGGIYVIRPDGTGERRLSAAGGWPSWFPDGSRIAYQVLGFDNRQRIRAVSLDGTDLGLVPGTPEAWPNSPIGLGAGNRLVISDVTVLASEIWLLEPRR
jgi:Tol biopolymer transport system component